MGKSVLITGCSEGGIGDALAIEFHSKGARVFATARNISKMKHLKAIGIETLSLDVTSPLSIDTAVATIDKATGGKLDILVNNSGIGRCLAAFRAYVLILTDTVRPWYRLFYANTWFWHEHRKRHIWGKCLRRSRSHSSLCFDGYRVKRQDNHHFIRWQPRFSPLDG